MCDAQMVETFKLTEVSEYFFAEQPHVNLLDFSTKGKFYYLVTTAYRMMIENQLLFTIKIFD
jgi:hypothetical protein